MRKCSSFDVVTLVRIRSINSKRTFIIKPIMKLLYLLLTTLSLGLFTQQFQFIHVEVSASNLPIPYEGLTLKWLHHETLLEEEMSETVLFKYTKGLSETRFQVMQLLPERWEETYEVDISTRKIISGSMEGDFTSHWIPTDISVGDKIDVWKSEYTAVSKNEEVNLPNIDDGVTIKCIKLEHTEEFYDIRLPHPIDVTVSLFYDANTGIRVKNLVLGQGYSFEADIAETGIDNDHDGLTDYHELFVTLTNPKTQGVVPDVIAIYYVLIAIVATVSVLGFFAYRFLKKKKGTN